MVDFSVVSGEWALKGGFSDHEMLPLRLRLLFSKIKVYKERFWFMSKSFYLYITYVKWIEQAVFIMYPELFMDK